jgi:hypothetical protein
VGVGAFERGDQGGSNGTGLTVAVAVLAEIWSFKKWVEFFLKIIVEFLDMDKDAAVVIRGVAVVWWEWEHSKEEIKAVRMM